MNPEVKAEWVAALRSGEHKQTTGHLKDDNGMCCLGVLCDIAAKHNADFRWDGDSKDGNGKDCYEFSAYGDGYPYTSNSVLPYTVTKWADLRDDNPRILEMQNKFGDSVSLAQLNDGNKEFRIERHTFAQIADIIEKYL